MTAKLRIAYFAQSRIPSREANSIQVMRMCQAFARKGHDVALAVPNYARREEGVTDVFAYYGVEPCFELAFLPSRPRGGRVHRYALQAARYARARKPDLVYSRSLKAAFLCCHSGLPTVLESHSIARGLDGIIYATLFRLLRKKHLRRVVVISGALGKAFAERYGYPPARIVVAHDAADDHGPPRPAPPTADRRLRVGYVGQLYRGRGMEIIERLAQACAWADFHVAGGREPELGQWSRRTDRVTNLTLHGFLPPAETRPLIESCDVLLAPYQTEVAGASGDETARWMSPLKVFEYMAAGRAIVISDLPVLREVLIHEQNALLVSPRDIDGWTAALRRLSEGPRLRETLGANAYRTFRSGHTWDRRADRVLDGLF